MRLKMRDGPRSQRRPDVDRRIHPELWPLRWPSCAAATLPVQLDWFWDGIVTIGN